MADLTDEELLQLVRRGVSDDDIARALRTQPAEAAERVRAALDRQGLHSRAGAVILGVLEHGTRPEAPC